MDFVFVLFDLLFELLDLDFQICEVVFFSFSCEFALGGIEYFFVGKGLAVGFLVFEEYGIGDGGTLRW